MSTACKERLATGNSSERMAQEHGCLWDTSSLSASALLAVASCHPKALLNEPCGFLPDSSCLLSPCRAGQHSASPAVVSCPFPPQSLSCSPLQASPSLRKSRVLHLSSSGDSGMSMACEASFPIARAVSAQAQHPQPQEATEPAWSMVVGLGTSSALQGGNTPARAPVTKVPFSLEIPFLPMTTELTIPRE